MSKRVAFLTAGEGIESVGLTEPWAVTGGGHSADLASPESGGVQLLPAFGRAVLEALG
ncbi:MAG: hypothetical protein ABIQ15_13670 [Nocardioides sp.]